MIAIFLRDVARASLLWLLTFLLIGLPTLHSAPAAHGASLKGAEPPGICGAPAGRAATEKDCLLCCPVGTLPGLPGHLPKAQIRMAKPRLAGRALHRPAQIGPSAARGPPTRL